MPCCDLRAVVEGGLHPPLKSSKDSCWRQGDKLGLDVPSMRTLLLLQTCICQEASVMWVSSFSFVSFCDTSFAKAT